MNTSPDLEQAYALSDETEIRTLYAGWAATYDTDFGAAMGYQLPGAVARAFVAAGGQGPVLDVGAGTGLVADHLASLGVGPLDAVDLSAQMLAVARDKQTYRSLTVANFLDDDHGLPRGYRGIVSAGTFTHGHLGPEALGPLLALLAAGGVAVVSVNLAHFEACDFASHIDALAPVITGFETRDLRIFDDRADPGHRADLARLVILRK